MPSVAAVNRADVANRSHRSVGLTARPADATGYDLYLHAYKIAWSSARQVPEALRLLAQALARGPNYGSAVAWAAVCHFRLLLYSQSQGRRTDRLKRPEFVVIEVIEDAETITSFSVCSIPGSIIPLKPVSEGH